MKFGLKPSIKSDGDHAATLPTNGTLTNLSYRSSAGHTGCGVGSMQKATSSMPYYKSTALRLMRKLLKSQSVTPTVMVTDKLRSYATAKAELTPGIEHRSHKGLNNRA